MTPDPLKLAEADLMLALSAVNRARAEYAARGFRTSDADIAEIRAGRFIAQHGESVLRLLSAQRRNN